MKTTLLAAALVALPLAAGVVASTPVVCSGTCAVPSTAFAFIPPVLAVESGSEVVFESLDTTHVNLDGSFGAADPCFMVSYSQMAASDPIRLDATDGGLAATVLGETKSCGNATPLDGGAYALSYFCILHPVMRGVFVVTP